MEWGLCVHLEESWKTWIHICVRIRLMDRMHSFWRIFHFYLQTFRQRHVWLIKQDGSLQFRVSPGDRCTGGSGLSCSVCHHMFWQVTVMWFIWNVQQDEDDIKPGQNRRAHSKAENTATQLQLTLTKKPSCFNLLQVFRHGLASVVMPSDGVCSSNDWCSGRQRANDSSFSHTHWLLLHSF